MVPSIRSTFAFFLLWCMGLSGSSSLHVRVTGFGTLFVIPSRQRQQSPHDVHISPMRSIVRRATTSLDSSSDGGKTTSLNKDEIARYSRHLVLGDVGMTGQKALKDGSVLVIGAGGLGSPCLLYLAAAGVGHIGIVDADTVDHSNLQRQIIHGTSTVGKTKCESARERILDVNPFVKVRTYEEEFTADTAFRILGDGFDAFKPTWDVVVDGSDNFPTKYLINDACELLNVPWVYSAILAFEGQMSVFNYQNGPTYRDMMPTPPPPGDVPSCAEGGVLGVLPGTMGCLQATEVLKILLGKQGILSGRILVYDALAMKFNELGLERLPAHERDDITELIDYQGFCAGPKAAVASKSKSIIEPAASTIRSQSTPPTTGRTMDEDNVNDNDVGDDTLGGPSFCNLGPSECLEKLTNGWSPWVLDVRLQTEHDIVALPFTDKVSPHRTVRINDIPKAGPVLVYCKAGVRGKKACQRLVELGVEPERLFNLDGGIMRWQQDVDPNMPRY
eukprot:scaffold101356_cov42-Attheya_sp.AAC.5